jgi:hypothetical protein
MDKREVQHLKYNSHEYDTSLHTSVFVQNVGASCHLECMKIHKNSDCTDVQIFAGLIPPFCVVYFSDCRCQRNCHSTELHCNFLILIFHEIYHRK